MPLKRFKKLKKFFHFIHNKSIPEGNRDIFIKIRPIITSLNETFSEVASPTEQVAFDEMIIPFKGCSRAKQYLRNKPKKWGFKAWVVASADGYQGAENNVGLNKCPTADAIIRICQGMEDLNLEV